ncbi:hypothetical protein OEZ86_011213 [Tetradesmus obliquus]|nr:hypothetical protein OEZ86_011213 [Tetradesmus obliquus]
MYSSSTAIAKQVQHPLAIPTLCSSRRGMLLLASSISLAGEAAEGQAGAALQEEQQAAGTTQLQLQQAMTAAVPMLHTYSRRQQQQQLAQPMWCRPEQAEEQQAKQAAAVAAAAAGPASSAAAADADEAEVKRVLSSKNDYEVLQLKPGCDAAALKKRYKELVVRLHPDKCKAADATLAFQRAHKAYQVLQGHVS